MASGARPFGTERRRAADPREQGQNEKRVLNGKNSVAVPMHVAPPVKDIIDGLGRRTRITASGVVVLSEGEDIE